MSTAHREEQLRIQALGAALSRRDWHATEMAYNAIRDEFDRRPKSIGVALSTPSSDPGFVLRDALSVAAERLEARGHKFGAEQARLALASVAQSAATTDEPYRQAVDDEMVLAHIGVTTGDAKRDLSAVINWNVDVALDPRVSERARALQTPPSTASSDGPTSYWQGMYYDLLRRTYDEQCARESATTPPDAAVLREALNITDGDKEYANDLISDLREEQNASQWHSIAAQWLRKARVEKSLTVPAQPAEGERERAVEECALVAVEMTRKWGNPNGNGYEQGIQDQGIRIAAQIRALSTRPADAAPVLAQDGGASPEPDAVRVDLAEIIEERAQSIHVREHSHPANEAREADKWAMYRIRQELNLLVAALSRPAHGGDRYRHVKTGGTYEVLGQGRVQTEEPLLDMEDVTIYRSEKDGSLWARHPDEFNDGRFEAIADARNERVPPQPITDAVTIVAPPIPPLLQREWMAQALFEVDAPDHLEWDDAGIDKRERYLALADTAIAKAAVLTGSPRNEREGGAT